ncbi:mechanosensitive ion channel protein MscS [Gammaproteobacteria bacterium 45_16_T64]|nr:mechanosensitive ion channel protein MscS [Gammaproteobacteria bacterium 45_16_T64]
MIDDELEQLEQVYQLVVNYLVEYSFQVVGAFIILGIGLLAAKLLSSAVVRLLQRRHVDVTLTGFMGSVTKILVLTCFVIISLGKFGITVAPFVAALGAATFGAGLALQGPVSNYGAGLAIILSRTFTIGDTVTVNGCSGIVKDIRLAHTLLETEDAEIITIPNKQIIGEVIHNSFSSKVVESTIGIDYAASPELAIQTIKNVLEENASVSKEPSFQVGIDSFGDFSIAIGLRYWVPMGAYFESKYQVNLAVFDALKSKGIKIPFPRQDIYLHQKENG